MALLATVCRGLRQYAQQIRDNDQVQRGMNVEPRSFQAGMSMENSISPSVDFPMLREVDGIGAYSSMGCV